MRFLLPGSADARLRRLVQDPPNCLGLFAAARAHGLGLVEGVPPHVYVPRVERDSLAQWRQLVPALPGERPDVILRQASAKRAIFDAVVRDEGMPRCDILQVWLDVSAHPARGAEQAEHIYRKIVRPVVEEAPA
jgi:hypothetical protein